MLRVCVVSFMILLLSTLIGCEQDRSAPSGVVQTQDGRRVVPREVGPPVTSEEAIRFTEELVEAILSPQDAGRSVNQLLSLDAFMDAALAGVELQPETEKAVRAKVAKGAFTQSFYRQVDPTVAGGGSYSYLNDRERDGRRYARMRLLDPVNGGVNYHDYVLTRDAAGLVVATDIYVYLTGEFISQSLRRLMVKAAAEENRSFLSRLSGNESVFLNHAQEFQQLSVAVQSGDTVRALEIYDSLPAEVQNMKLCLLMQVTAAATLEDDPDGIYEGAIGKYRALFPGDAAIDFLSIDYFLVREEFAACLEAIDRVYDDVRDPYLLVIKTGVLLQSGNLAEAERQIRDVMDLRQDLELANTVALDVALATRDHSWTAAILGTLSDDYGYEWSDLTGVEGFEEFVTSDEYEAFRNEYQ